MVGSEHSVHHRGAKDTENLRFKFTHSKQRGSNIKSDILEPEDIGKLYGARWDIELMFKELKSRYALDALDTKILR